MVLTVSYRIDGERERERERERENSIEKGKHEWVGNIRNISFGRVVFFSKP